MRKPYMATQMAREHIATHCNTHIKKARVTCECVMDASSATHDRAHVIQMNASCCVWLRCWVQYTTRHLCHSDACLIRSKLCVSHTKMSRHVWVSYITYESYKYAMSNMNYVVCNARQRNDAGVMHEYVEAYVHAFCHVWMRRVQCVADKHGACHLWMRQVAYEFVEFNAWQGTRHSDACLMGWLRLVGSLKW